MTIDKRHLEELADLAIEIRPHGAPRWDKAGVVAALLRVQHIRLSEVTRVVIAAAEDRSLQTPAAIGNVEAPVWRVTNPAALPAAVRTHPGRLCSVCSLPESRCRAQWSDDHEYLSNDALRKEVEQQDPYERDSRLAELRATIRGGRRP